MTAAAGRGAERRSPLVWQVIDSRSVGGAERHIALLSNALQRRGFRVEVVLLADYGDNPWFQQLSAAGVGWRVLDGSVRSIFHALRQARPSLVHTHGYKAGILGRALAALLGIPRVSTFHSGGHNPFPVWAYQRLDEWTSWLGERIAVSAPIGRSLPFAAVTIPNWVTIPEVPQTAPLPPRVAFVGRLSPEKGPDLFCELARRSASGLEWHVYGDGPMRADLERRFGDIVRFHGIVPDLQSIWPGVGLLCMPSHQEGIPLAALEALAAGVPVLASDVGGMPSIVIPGYTGWLFPPGDLDEAARLLASWRDVSAEPGKIRCCCWGHARGRFSEGPIVPQILATYRAAGWSAMPTRGAAA